LEESTFSVGTLTGAVNGQLTICFSVLIRSRERGEVLLV